MFNPYSKELLDASKQINMSEYGNDLWKMMNLEKRGEMNKVILKVEVEGEAYKTILETSFVANEEMIFKSSAKDLKVTNAMFKLIDAIHAASFLFESDDAVSRQAVLKINENHHGEMPNHINFEIWNEIKALPPVLPKRKHGKWTTKTGSMQMTCSCCNKDTWYSGRNDYVFCPNCGAEMR